MNGLTCAFPTINITIPKGSEDLAGSFYTGRLGLREIPKPKSIRHRSGVWLEADGLRAG